MSRALLVSKKYGDSASKQVCCSAKQVLGDNVALDLVGAHIDLESLGVTHVFLYRILFDIAVASKNLQGIYGDLHGDVRSVALADS